MKNTFFILIIIISTLFSNSVDADTQRVNNNCFSGTEGFIDTGYRSIILDNSTSQPTSVAITIVNVTTNIGILSPESYNQNWNYFQSNIFSSQIENGSSSAITIKVNSSGFKSNISVIIWRLRINSTTQETINTCLRVEIAHTFHTIVPIPLNEVVDNSNNKNTDNSEDLLVPVGSIIVIGLILSYYFWWVNQRQKGRS